MPSRRNSSPSSLTSSSVLVKKESSVIGFELWGIRGGGRRKIKRTPYGGSPASLILQVGFVGRFVYIRSPCLRLFPPFLPSFLPSQHRTLNTTTTIHPEDHKDDNPRTQRTTIPAPKGQQPQDPKDDNPSTNRTTIPTPKGRQSQDPKDDNPWTKRTTAKYESAKIQHGWLVGKDL